MSSSEWILIDRVDSNEMNSETIASHRLYRPRLSAEVHIRNRVERHLRAKYKPGVYSGGETVNEIIQHQFSFYSNVLTPVVKKLASLHFMQFLLYQYDLAAKVDQSVRSLKTGHHEQARWSELGPTFRRTIKYLAERIVLLAPGESPKTPEEELLDALDKAWICSEEIIRLYNLSEQTHSLFPDSTQLTINPPGKPHYFDLTVSKLETLQFKDRVRAVTVNRSKYLPGAEFLSDVDKHDKLLGPALRNHIGITYKEAVHVLAMLIEGTEPPTSGFPIPFVHQGRGIQELSKILKLPRKSIKVALAGFSLTKPKMMSENRVVWKPKQEYRAYRRAFFEFPHPSGPHFIWSKEMAKESLIQLVSEVAFKQFPFEWTTPQVDRAIEGISNAAGKWFESVCADNLKKLGFEGTRTFKDKIGAGSPRLAIPSTIGELDCLGYSPSQKLLLVAECKLVRPGSEAVFFRDDLSKFTSSSDSYANQLRRKAEWVVAQYSDICSALQSIKGFPSEIRPKRIAWVLITYFPSIAYYMIDDFPCVSLTELMIAHEEKGKWPYQIGIAVC